MVLWKEEIKFPDFEHFWDIRNIEFRTAHCLDEKGYHFLLGAAVVKHENTLRVSFAQSLKTENDDHTRLMEKVSFDGGFSWTENIIAETEDGFGRSHGVYFPYQNKLYVFCPRARYDRIDRYPELKTEIYRLGNDGKYQLLGTALDGDFWPMCEPIALENGTFLMAGLKTDSGTAAVALCDGTDITKWNMTELPNPRNFRYWGETTVLRKENRLIALVRNSGRIRNILTSESTDNGITWTGLSESDFPASHSKLYTGTLKNGLSYLVFNVRDRGERIGRDTLAIAVGYRVFERVYLIRDGFDGLPVFWQHNEWSYPYAFEDTEKDLLYVAYAKNKEHCEVAVIPTESLLQ